MGVWGPMTAMPQRTALSHAFGAFAAALVGIAEYYSYTHGFKPLADLGHVKMSAMGFEIMLGSLTTTGSLNRDHARFADDHGQSDRVRKITGDCSRQAINLSRSEHLQHVVAGGDH